MSLAVFINATGKEPPFEMIEEAVRACSAVRTSSAPEQPTNEEVAREIRRAIWAQPRILLLDAEPVAEARLAMREAIDDGIAVFVLGPTGFNKKESDHGNP